MEHRISRGDFQIVQQQVVLGGTSTDAYRIHDAFTYQNGVGMAPEDIYDMAITQVVGIRTEVPGAGMLGSASSNTVAGSGFVISTDGYILTNFHVIEAARDQHLPINVFFHNGAEFDAKIIGYDANNDVALLKIEATGLNPVVIANSDNIRVGSSILAVGNPLGNLVFTMTPGMISALDREVTVEGKIIDTFQFSAPVNSGNSGGPIYDANGEVIGIVTAKLSRPSVEGIAFAIPINDAIEIASGLIEYGYIAGRPLIGISGNTVSSGHAEYYEWVVGAYIRAVTSGSAAERAGLEVGDIIVGLGGVEVTSMETLRFAMRRYTAGDTTTLDVWRSGEVIEVVITFDEDLAAGQPRRPAPTLPEGENGAPRP